MWRGCSPAFCTFKKMLIHGWRMAIIKRQSTRKKKSFWCWTQISGNGAASLIHITWDHQNDASLLLNFDAEAEESQFGTLSTPWKLLAVSNFINAPHHQSLESIHTFDSHKTSKTTCAASPSFIPRDVTHSFNHWFALLPLCGSNLCALSPVPGLAVWLNSSVRPSVQCDAQNALCWGTHIQMNWCEEVKKLNFALFPNFNHWKLLKVRRGLTSLTDIDTNNIVAKCSSNSMLQFLQWLQWKAPLDCDCLVCFLFQTHPTHFDSKND